MESTKYIESAGHIALRWYSFENPRCDAVENCDRCPFDGDYCSDLSTAAHKRKQAMKAVDKDPYNDAALAIFDAANLEAMNLFKSFVSELDDRCDRACHTCPVECVCTDIRDVVQHQINYEEEVE